MFRYIVHSEFYSKQNKYKYIIWDTKYDKQVGKTYDSYDAALEECERQNRNHP